MYSNNETQQDPLDKEQLEELIELFGDEFVRLIGSFLENTANIINSMEEAARTVNTKKLYELAHKLRGSSSTFCTTALPGMCMELECQSKTGKATDAAKNIKHIKVEYKRIQTALEEVKKGFSV